MEKLSYALGMVIGHNLKGMGVKNLSSADFARAIDSVMQGQTCELARKASNSLPKTPRKTAS